MIESILQRQLQPIIDRETRMLRSRAMLLYWVAAAIAIGVLCFVCSRADAWSGLWIVLAIAASFAGMALVRKRAGRSRIDVSAVAKEIEANHPELQSLLVTAVEQDEGSGGKPDYLQERVIRDAARAVIANQWGHTFAESARKRWHIAEMASLAVFAAALLAFIGVNFAHMVSGGVAGGGGSGTGATAEVDLSVSVDPGDVELESGRKLVVSAQFGASVPPEATLVVESLGGEIRRLAMRESLADGLFGGVIPEIVEDSVYHVAFEGGISEVHTIDTFVLPRLKSAAARIVPPNGSGLEPKQVKDARRVQLLEGSTLELAIEANVPVASAVLRGGKDDGIALPLVPVSGESARFELAFQPEADTRLRLFLSDAEGRENVKKPAFVIKVKRNLPPNIELAFPRKDAIVSPLQELAVEAKIWDDVKVLAAGATYVFGGMAHEISFDTETFKPDKKETVAAMLNFEELGAAPNDLLTYHFWAEDTGPDGAARRASSDMFFAEVRHFEQIYREAQAPPGQGAAMQANQSEELVNGQKDIINATWTLERIRKKIAEDAEVIRFGQDSVIEKSEAAKEEVSDAEMLVHLDNAIASMHEASEVLEKIANSGNGDLLADALTEEQEAYQHLLRMRAREFQVMKAQQSQSQGSAAQQQQQRQMLNMELKQEDKRYETERFASEQEREQRTQENSEDLQMLNRLKELAERQNAISDKLKDLQAALEAAETEEEREELLRELKRLEEEQRELLALADELNEQMEEEDNRARTAEAREQLEQTRENLQQASEQMERGELSEATASSTRAQRELDEMADDFRERTSSRFAEEMREMRREARELAAREEELSKELEESIQRPEEFDPFESAEDRMKRNIENAERSQEIGEQRENLEDFLDRLREISEESEESEPLLSRRLYESVREAQTSGASDALDDASRLVRYGRSVEASESEREAKRAIDELKEGVEAAAESVLGDEAEALRIASAELDRLIEDVEEEAKTMDGGGEGDPRESSQEGEASSESPPNQGDQPGSQPSNQARGEESSQQPGRQPGQQEPGDQPGQQSTDQPGQDPGQQPGRQPGEQPGQGQPGDQPGREPGNRPGQQEPGEQPGRQPGSQPGEQSSDSDQPGQQPGQQPSDQPGSQPGQQPSDQPSGQPRQGSFFEAWAAENRTPGPGGQSTGNNRSAIFGDNFQGWADRTRDVEEMVDDPELAREIARVRGRALEMRRDYLRHSVDPQWALVETRITSPLVEIRDRIDEARARLKAGEDSLAPIDRDPVPTKFRDLVRRYYESLGEDVPRSE